MKKNFGLSILTLCGAAVLIFGIVGAASSAEAQFTEPNFKWAWDLIVKELDLRADALTTGQDMATRTGYGEPPHPTDRKGVERLYNHVQKFYDSRFKEKTEGRDGVKLTKAMRMIRTLESEASSQNLPSQTTFGGPTRDAAISAGRKLLQALSDSLQKDLVITDPLRPNEYGKYYEENRSSLERKFSSLKRFKSNGDIQKVNAPLTIRVKETAANLAESTKVFAAENMNKKSLVEYGKKFGTKSVNLLGLAGGMGAYAMAEHFVLCMKDDDPDCTTVLNNFTSTRTGFFYLSSFVLLLQSTRFVTNKGLNWALKSMKKPGFGEDSMLSFWLGLGASTIASQVVQAWFAAEYVPRFERIKKEYAFVINEIPKVEAEIKAAQNQQPGQGGFRSKNTLVSLEKYRSTLVARKIHFDLTMESHFQLFWKDIKLRAEQYDQIAYDFVKAGLIMSWIAKAKGAGQLTMEGLRMRQDIQSGLKNYAKAEKEELVKLLKDQSAKTLEIERAGIRGAFQRLGKATWYQGFKQSLRYIDTAGVGMAKVYGTVPGALKLAGGAVAVLFPKKFLGPLQGTVTWLFENVVKHFVDAAAFAFVYNSMDNTINWLGKKWTEAALFPSLYKNHLEMELALHQFVKIPLGGQITAYLIANGYSEFYEKYALSTQIWSNYRDRILYKPIEHSLDQWQSWISAYATERYKEREWMGFFHRTASKETLEAYQNDERFLDNGKKHDKLPWHMDMALWPGELRDENLKYWKVYESEVWGKKVDLEKYLLAKEAEAHKKIVEKQSEKIAEIGKEIDRVYVSGSSLQLSSGANVMIDLLRSVKSYATENNVPHCEVPVTPGNMNSSYIEQVKYTRLLILSWVRKYPSALEAREMRELVDGLRHSPCDFGPFRSRLKMTLENLADLDHNVVHALVGTHLMEMEKFRWSVVARVVGRHLYDLLDAHQVNFLKYERLKDLTWNYEKRVGRLELLQENVGKALIAHQEERRIFVDSQELNGLKFGDRMLVKF
ncbi:MAG: hypothetical protein K2X47_02180, partial [Bdellovibrionales bacterium]|nr:hypothetical protein [Bdellovibrionales bacterium]